MRTTWFLLRNLLGFLLRYRECRLQGGLPCILLAPSIGQIRGLGCEGRGQEGEEEDGEHYQADQLSSSLRLGDTHFITC